MSTIALQPVDRVEILSEPAEFPQHLASDHLVELLKVLGSARPEFDLAHLPFQAAAASHFGAEIFSHPR